MLIPGLKECLQMMEQYKMLPNIQGHSLVVARVAEALVDGLQKYNPAKAPNRELILAGALLHDIAKTICLTEDCSHAELGGEICRKHGYPEIAEIVEAHVIPQTHEPERYAQGVFLPQEIVFYADKRVNHCEIVSLDERIAYIMEKYGNNDPTREQRIRSNFDRCFELEHFLFAHLDFKPNQLGKN